MNFFIDPEALLRATPLPFAVGEKIVCVDDRPYKRCPALRRFQAARGNRFVPKWGEIYVVRGWNDSPRLQRGGWFPPRHTARALVLLVGVFGEAIEDGSELGFVPDIFRPLDEVRRNNRERLRARRPCA